jgi:hypothetical protein
MSGNPWISFCEMPKLVATNTLYVVHFTCSERDTQAAIAMFLLTSWASEQLREVARVYADGLVKFEPGDLLGLRVPRTCPRKGAWVAYSKAITELLSGNVVQARAIADAWFTLTTDPRQSLMVDRRLRRQQLTDQAAGDSG